MRKWFADVWNGLSTAFTGMGITWRHLFTKPITLQYPDERRTLPARSRMRLFMKYEDCIGCGQCVRVCPVQCIYLKTEKRAPTAPAIFAATGHAIKLDVKLFDIDMSLCCYCNLCTYPCPTECLYMTPDYEFATTDLGQHLYHFAKPDAEFLTTNPKAAAPAKPAASATPAGGTTQGTP